MTIAPKFLDELNKEQELIKKLDENIALDNSIDYKFNEDFRLNMLEDQAASEKLSEGITGFSNAIEEQRIYFQNDTKK